jgi:hypothetical protein
MLRTKMRKGGKQRNVWHFSKIGGLHLAREVNPSTNLPLPRFKEAKASGLLESRRLGELLNEELRRERARKDLGRVLKELHSLPGEPMSPDEIQAEIDEVRVQSPPQWM